MLSWWVIFYTPFHGYLHACTQQPGTVTSRIIKRHQISQTVLYVFHFCGRNLKRTSAQLEDELKRVSGLLVVRWRAARVVWPPWHFRTFSRRSDIVMYWESFLLGKSTASEFSICTLCLRLPRHYQMPGWERLPVGTRLALRDCHKMYCGFHLGKSSASEFSICMGRQKHNASKYQYHSHCWLLLLDHRFTLGV